MGFSERTGAQLIGRGRARGSEDRLHSPDVVYPLVDHTQGLMTRRKGDETSMDHWPTRHRVRRNGPGVRPSENTRGVPSTTGLGLERAQLCTSIPGNTPNSAPTCPKPQPAGWALTELRRGPMNPYTEAQGDVTRAISALRHASTLGTASPWLLLDWYLRVSTKGVQKCPLWTLF